MNLEGDRTVSSGLCRAKIAPLKEMGPVIPLANDESGVDVEPVWSKSNIARRMRRHNIVSKRCARRGDILTRRVASCAARTALQCSMYKEAQEEMLERLKARKKEILLKDLTLATSVSKCH